MISVYFLWFDHWTLKEWSTAKVQNHFVSAYCPRKLWHTYCCHIYFFPARFLNMCKPRTTFYLFDELAQLDLHFIEVEVGHHIYRTGLGWWIQADLVLCDQKCSCKSNLSFFKAIPPNRLPFNLGSPLHIIRSLFSQFCSFQNSILHKMLKLGSWNFKPIFFSENAVFIGCNFSSLVLVICLSWYLHLKPFHEFLTFISFKSIRSSRLEQVNWHFESQMVLPNIYKVTKRLVWT